jgi:hypothetical protein
MKKFLINPFERIAGWKALSIGLCFISLTAILGNMNHLLFDRITYVTFRPHTLVMAFCAQTINLIIVSLVMWIAGKIFSKSKIRIIDVAGTMALSRAPLLLIALIGFLPIFSNIISDLYKSIFFALLCVIPIIWTVALMYRAYSVSCNLNATRGVLSFVGALIIAEILSLIIFFSVSIYTDNNQGKDAEIIIPQEQTINQTAEIVMEAFQKSDVKTVRAYFDERMKNGLSETSLRFTWMSLTAQYGKLKDYDTNVEAQHQDNYSVLLIPCTFERGKLNMQFAFSSEGKISGLYFK